jgi:ligand-binding sensor domain-containing protein
MNINKFLAISFLGIASLNSPLQAQDRPVGYWRSHLPYNTAVGVAVSGTTVYVATKQSFYIYQSNDEMEAFSKVEGMSDIGMSCIGYDKYTGTVVLGYDNSNIDLYKDGSFYNLPDLKLKSVVGSKRINQILTADGIAYLSTDVGIIVLNLEKREIKETYSFSRNGRNIAIREVALLGNDIYAATEKGLYRANRNNINLQAFSSWTGLDTVRNFISVVNQDDKLFVTGVDSLFALETAALRFVYKSDTTTRRLDKGVGGVWLIQNFKNFTGALRKFGASYDSLDYIATDGHAVQITQNDDPDQTIHIADEFRGLRKRTRRAPLYATVPPPGPPTNTAFDIYAYNKEVWLAHGGYNERWEFVNNVFGASRLKDDTWKNYDRTFFNNKVYDITNVIKSQDGTVYLGSHQNGLIILKPDQGTYEIFDENSILDESAIAKGKRIIGGFALDAKNNLWMTVFGGTNELAQRTKEGDWTEFFVPFGRPAVEHAAGSMVIDDNNQKWYTAPRGGGVIVFNENASPKSRMLVAGEGVGGLPNNTVYSIDKDKNGAIWIGTATGIGIVSCPSQVIEAKCEAKLNTVQYDDFAGHLFQNEVVRSIATDGSNRKWIGTNNGVWLISPDGDKVISRFNAANSPLPSDRIQKISIDPVTGDVYISTEEGLISYRGTATTGTETMDKAITYPNPVPSGYTGTIAIRGLIENSDVRITDISGHLVYRTKALGGQAVWDGKDYTGRRPQSGVYLIFVTNRDGSQTGVGKMVFME